MEKIVGFDADGVLFPTEEFQISKKVVTLMKKMGHSIINENGYGIKEVYGCDSTAEISAWKNPSILLYYMLFYPAIEKMKQTIQQLRSEGVKVYIITAKPYATENSAKGVLIRFFFETGLKLRGIHVDGIHYCTVENSASEKVQLCQKLNVSVYVEDEKNNIRSLRSNIPRVLRMETKNNTLLAGEKDDYCVHNADEIYTAIKQFFSYHGLEDDFWKNFSLLSKEKQEKISRDDSRNKAYQQQMLHYYQNLPFDSKKLNNSEKWFHLISIFVRLYFKHKYHPKTYGIEKLSKMENYILVSNHLTDKDMLLIMSTLPIPWHPLVKAELMDGKFQTILKKIGAIPVDRSNIQSRADSMREMGKILVHGSTVLVFPEGTYNNTVEPVMSFQGKSPVCLSQRTQIPILTLAITKDYDGSYSPIVRIEGPVMIHSEQDLGEANQQLWNQLSNSVIENEKIKKLIISMGGQHDNNKS